MPLRVLFEQMIIDLLIYLFIFFSFVVPLGGIQKIKNLSQFINIFYLHFTYVMRTQLRELQGGTKLCQ